MSDQKTYAQREAMWNKAEAAKASEKQLAQSFNTVDVYLNRTYLKNFSLAPIIPANKTICDLTKLRLVEISKLVYDEKENFLDKMMSVYSALHSFEATVSLILNSDGNEVKFYIGVRSEVSVATVGDVLESTLKGNFPGIVFQSLDLPKIQNVVEGIKDKGVKSLATVSMVPSARKKDAQIIEFVQGIEKFIDTMSGKSYTLISIASPLSQEVAQKRKHGYEELCSILSPYSKLSVAYGENDSLAVNKSLSLNFSKSTNRSVSNSNSTSTSNSSGSNSGQNSSSSWGGSVSDSGFSGNWGGNNGYSSGSFDSYTSGNSFTQSVSDSEGTSSSEGLTEGETKTSGSSKTITLNFDNKGIGNLVERVEAQLERFKISESFGMWEFCSYFISKDVHTTALAGNAYKALMSGDESNIESAHLNIWSINQTKTIQDIMDYVLHFSHPQAELPALEGGYGRQLVTPTNLISGHELPLVMGVPKKSVAGLAVVEMAEFGRGIVYENSTPKQTIDFGNIYHMGVEEQSRVKMDLNLFSSHCFITGSSGSGKSYATYQVLESLLNNDVKIMIIEPAKGEYKQIFGGLKGVKIFTTDPNTYRLLKINPFQFPANIHLLSHIEQLLQIFNASWPLYAAMPAILKQSIVEAYVKCGWDVQNSIWIQGISERKYPVFEDILEILPQIINVSDYSADSKGDYKGALVTRVQSMTVGINGLVFKNSMGVDDSLLFDSNVVIDLSELGSDEAIALIMGVLIMKLNEYRKSERKSNSSLSLNSNLRHVTVLEEAHNLLKRTSKDQNQEGANMVGKSVEMISNSIKELRTYGEGFLIIDQSPMAVDTSAIENTATKIIMNTPARDACEELGSALSLNDAQTRELSKLNVGVAAVYQKGWLSPVLMKIDKWDDRYHANVEVTDQSVLRILRGDLTCALLEQYESNKFSPMKLRGIVRSSGIASDKRREIDEILMSYTEKVFESSKKSKSCFGSLLLELIGCEQLFTVIPTENIPDYDDFLKFQDAENFDDFFASYEKNSELWLEITLASLENYLTVNSDVIKAEIILFLLFVIGAEGKVKFNSKNKMAMICRMLHWKLGLPIE
ncbi:MAG: DUF87 domain-containing protein [Eubacteriales bacterium]